MLPNPAWMCGGLAREAVEEKLIVNEQIEIPEGELEETFVRAGGPGGRM